MDARFRGHDDESSRHGHHLLKAAATRGIIRDAASLLPAVPE
jgi:hypothetical protein